MISISNNPQGEGQPSSLSSSLDAIPRTQFEDLSVELILQIFDLFWRKPNLLYEAFHNMNSHLNNILGQTKFHIERSSYSLVPHPVHYEQIKSLRIAVGRECPNTLALLEYVSPKMITSLDIIVYNSSLRIRPVISILRNFSKLTTFNITVGLLSEELEQELYQTIRQLHFLKSYSIQTIGNFPLSPILEPFPFSTTIVHLTTRFMDLTKLDVLYGALPNLKRLDMRPCIGKSENSTSEPSINSIPPPSLKYLRLHLVNREIFPFKYIEWLLRTFPPTQLQYLSIFEECIEEYYNSDVWFSILTMSTLKLKQLQIKLISEEVTVHLIQRLHHHFGDTTQIIQCKQIHISNRL